VLTDEGSNINVTFPGLSMHSGSPSLSYKSLTLLSSASCRPREYPLGHISLPMTFGTPENYRTEFLRFEVARFDCAYNAITRRPRMAKFMAISHCTYMMLKILGPQCVVTVKADFRGSVECYRGAIQMALASNTSVAQKQLLAEARTLPKDDLSVPTMETTPTPTICLPEETKKVSLGLLDARMMTTINSSLNAR
jgi:hypothetical protein